MHLTSRVNLAISLILTPACRMLYITAEQDESGAGTLNHTTAAPAQTTTSSGAPDEGSDSSTSIILEASDSASFGADPDTETGVTSTTSLSSTTDVDPTITSSAEGDFTSGNPEICGDGKIEGSEQCDDGEFVNLLGRYCSTDCKIVGLLAFVTSATFTGDILAQAEPGIRSGVEAADAACNAAAQNIREVGKNPNFLAWISAWNADQTIISSPENDFIKCKTPYFSPKHSQQEWRDFIAFSYDDIKSPKGFKGTIRLWGPIRISEFGEEIKNKRVLTGTRADGLPDFDKKDMTDCANWSDSSEKALTTGSTGQITTKWTEHNESEPENPLGYCNQSFHIYCFEQCPPP